MEFTRRWKGWTQEEVSERMRALAKKRVQKMTKEQKTEHAKKMTAGRGQWMMVGGVRKFVKRNVV